MDGLSQDVLAFLIDIQEHGANQLRALSADFKALGATADQIGGRLKVLEGQLAKTAATSTAAGDKLAASSRVQVAETGKQVAATGQLTAAQKAQAGEASSTAAATDRLAAAQKAQAGEARAAAGATASQAGAQQQLAGATAGAAGALGRHSAQVDEHRKRLEKLKSTSSEFGHVMNTVSLPLLATGGIAIKMGLDFEAAMSRLHTQAGFAETDVKQLEAAVLKAAPALRRTPTELAEGLYHVASVGIPARDAMRVMEAASIGANIGASNLMSTANGLVIVMKNMGQGAGAAKEDMALLNEIVGAGNLHMEDLVTSLGKVLPQAKVFGLGLRDVGAALDVLTARGMDAHMAATRLAMSFNLLGAPKPAASKALSEIGLSATKLGEDLRKPEGVLVAVRDLRDHLDAAFPPGRKLNVDEERAALQTYKTTLEAAGEQGKTLTKHLEEFADKLSQTHSAETAQAAILSAAFGGGRQSGAILALVQNVDDLRKSYQRLPEGAQALKRLQDAQATWEKTSQAQLDAVKASFTTTLTSIGQNLAPVVLPVLKDIAGDVEHIVHAFEKLPTPVQHVAEAFIGLVAIAGPLAGIVSKFATAALLVEKLRRGGPLPTSGPLGTATPGGVVGQVAKAEMMLTGLRGTGVGSRVNPIVVAVLGQVPGGGAGFSPIGSKTASEAEKDIAQAERRSPGGVILPTGVGGAATVAEEAGGAVTAASVGSRVLSFGKTALGRAMGGGAIALGGLAVSEIAGSLIGGHTGKTVSGIGNDAAMGAALGSVIEPGIGTAIGAGFGGVIGAIKALQGPSHAEAAGEAAASGGKGGPHFDSKTRQYVEQAVSRNQEAIDKEIARIEAAAPRAPRRGGFSEGRARAGGMGRQPELGGGEQHDIATLRQGGNLFAGTQAGAAEAKYVLGGVRFPELDSIVRVAKQKMSELAPAARVGYANMIRAAVEQLEREKRLPEHAISELNHSIAASFGSLAKESGLAGALSMRALRDNLKGDAALGSAKQLVDSLRKIWSGIPESANVTTRNAGAFFERAGVRLRQVIATTSGEQKQAAEQAYKELQKNAAGFYGGMVKEAEANLTTLAHQSGPLSKQGTESVERNYEHMRKTIETEVRLGVLSPKQGLAELARATPPLALAATNPVSKAYAQMRSRVEGAMAGTESSVNKGLDQVAKKAQAALAKLMGQNAQTNLGNTPAPKGPGAAFGPGLEGTVPGGAKGMRIPGEVGPDNTPIYSPRGGLRGIVAGGELLIANRHTEQRVNAMLRHFGTSLGHEVAGERRPHSAPRVPHAATGLRIRGPVSTFGPPGEPAGGTAYGRSSSEAGIAVNPHGGGNWNDALARSLALQVARVVVAGHSANLRVIDKGPSAIGSHGPRLIDITGAGVAALGLPYGSFPTDAIGEAIFGEGGKAIEGGAGAAAPRLRQPPWTGPGGALGRIGRAILAKATAAANARLAASAATQGTGAGAIVAATGAPPTGGGFSPAQLGTFDGLPVAQWIIPELMWARAHGWKGHITSGYRAGFDPHAPSGSMHALDIYPGGAVDFGGMVDAAGLANRAAFIAATAGYPGKRLLTPIGFRDDGHMSGTGHALGGRMNFAGAFGDGGAFTADKPTLALFGDKGRETVLAVPHADTGAQLLESIGVTPTGPKGEKEVEGLNPDNNQIETHTPAEWRRIRNLHSQYTKAHPKARKPAVPTVTDLIQVGGDLAGIVDLKAGQAPHKIEIPGSVKKLPDTIWKKVEAAIEKTLKDTTAGDELGLRITGELSRDAAKHPSKRLTELATKAVQDTSAKVMSVLKRSPVSPASTSQAVDALGRLLADAERLHNTTVMSALRKNVEATIQRASQHIASQLQHTEGRATAGVDLRIAQAQLARIRSAGAGVALSSRPAADPRFVAEQQAAASKAIAEYQAEQRTIQRLIHREQGLLKKLQAKMRAELKRHHKAAAKAIESEIKQIEAALGEAQTQLDEVAASIEAAMTSKADLEAEHLKAVYEEFVEEVHRITESLEAAKQSSQTRERLEEGERHLEGKDFSGLETAKQEQGGVLTPTQIAQAQADLAAYTKRHQEQINIDQQQKAYEESIVGGLSGPERAAMERSIEELGLNIVELKDQIYDQTAATKKLTDATNNNTKAYGGTVGFEFQGQQYVSGSSSMSSVSGSDIMVGT